MFTPRVLCRCILQSLSCLLYGLCHRLIPGFIYNCIACSKFGGIVPVLNLPFFEVMHFIALKTIP